jgi:hypothetical protein
MAGIKHAKVATHVQDPTKDVTQNEWNDEHTIDDACIPIVKLSNLTRQFFVPLNGKIADIKEVNTNKYLLDLAAALSETRKIIAVILDARRISGTGNLYYYANEGTQATIDYLTGRARLVIIADATHRLQYSQSVANDDFDLYCMGYTVEA